MKNLREIKIGITALISLGLLYYGINYLKGSDLFKTEDTYLAVYNQIDGLSVSNPVMLNGFRVGRVDEIYLIPGKRDKVVVSFVIDDETLTLPANSVARIVSADLLGAKIISLEIGDSEQLAASGDTLVSGNEEALNTIIETKLKPLETKLDRILGEVDTLVGKVGVMVDESIVTVGSVKRSFQNLERTTLRLDTLMADNKDKIGGITSNLLSITSNIRSNNQEITYLIENFSAISDSLAKADLAQTINNANRSVSELAEVMEKINNGDGSLGQLVNDKQLYNNLDSAAKDLDLLLIDLRKNPRRYLHFSIFGRKK